MGEATGEVESGASCSAVSGFQRFLTVYADFTRGTARQHNCIDTRHRTLGVAAPRAPKPHAQQARAATPPQILSRSLGRSRRVRLPHLPLKCDSRPPLRPPCSSTVAWYAV